MTTERSLRHGGATRRRSFAVRCAGKEAGIMAGVILALGAVSGSGAEGIRLIRGFEPDEMVGQTSRDPVEGKHWKFVGKLWTGGGIPPGWRVKDHLGELTLPADHAGPVTLYGPDGSRDNPGISLFPTGATQGKYAMGYVVSEQKGKYIQAPGVTACPPNGGYHDCQDWYFQRECLVWKEAGDTLDWSPYDRLRFDVFSSEAPTALGVKIRDRLFAKGPKDPNMVGIRTGLAVFKIPQGKSVTCEYPLAEMARVAELDLSKLQWMHIRLNGFEGKTGIYLDNIRLLAPDAREEAKLDIIKMEGAPRPFARKVWDKNLPPRDRTAFKRETGPVEGLGPVTVFDGPGGHACSLSHFGGGGSTYFQSLRRGVVAHDNKRLLLVFGAGGPGKDARVVTWGGSGEGSKIWATASFDGGRTWGGLKPADASPVCLPDWYWRATASSDGSGDLYYIGTENCDSYVEGHDVFFRRLAFAGEGWEYDRMTIIDQNEYKCPGPARALRLASGRLWAAWTDGFNGPWIKRSDDDGLTWMPCKDAAAKGLPRPFYEPKLEDLRKPDPPKPPAELLLWPAEPAAGPLLVPCRGQVAAFAYDGSQWAVHDGKAWGAVQKLPWKGKGGQASEAAFGEDRVFLARVEGDKLLAVHLNGREWKGPEELDTGKIGSSILTASGESVFCFYVKTEGEEHNVYVRRWKGGQWGPAEKVATEKDAINQLAAPAVSPPDYAPVFWDQVVRQKQPASWIRFARIPNRP